MSADLENLIQRLTAPVSDAERADGWTSEAKAGIVEYFRRQSGALNAKAIPGLVRGLDAWEVSGGDLFHEALRVNRSLATTAAKDR